MRARRPDGWPRLRPGVDVLLVAVLTAVTMLTIPLLDGTRPEYRAAGPAAFILVALAAGATLCRHRWPVQAVVVAAAAVAAYLAASYPYNPIFAFVVLTVYAVARHRRFSTSAVLAAIAFMLLSIHLLTNEAALPGSTGVGPTLAWVAIPFTVGAARRQVVEARERERAAADQRLITAERLRLAEEVHDVVSHGLAAIQMQADIALHSQPSRPEQASQALEAISRASAEALAELRVTLDTIHPARSTDGSARAPTPGLASVADLIRRVEESGVEVDLDIDGEVQPLPGAADVAAYRVLQEALTNVVKHSAHHRADVRIHHDLDAVTLVVTNQSLAPAPVEGIGIGGMRRRVTQFGGTLRAGPGPQTGTFQVRATIPRNQEEYP